MVFITAKAYENAGVDVIKDNENYFWVKMKDVQNGLDLKDMRDSVRKQLCGIVESTYQRTKAKIYKIKKRNK